MVFTGYGSQEFSVSLLTKEAQIDVDNTRQQVLFASSCTF
jgi:hypothetical protein